MQRSQFITNNWTNFLLTYNKNKLALIFKCLYHCILENMSLFTISNLVYRFEMISEFRLYSIFEDAKLFELQSSLTIVNFIHIAMYLRVLRDALYHVAIPTDVSLLSLSGGKAARRVCNV